MVGSMVVRGKDVAPIFVIFSFFGANFSPTRRLKNGATFRIAKARENEPKTFRMKIKNIFLSFWFEAGKEKEGNGGSL